MTGYVPLLLCGVLLFGLVLALPRLIRATAGGRRGGDDGPAAGSEQAPLRRRSIATVSDTARRETEPLPVFSDSPFTDPPAEPGPAQPPQVELPRADEPPAEPAPAEATPVESSFIESPLVELPPVAAPPPPAPQMESAIAETMSVILRRQVPPRFDQPARSWIGGLPRMPDDMAWPRSSAAEHRDERPLHFVAQICCDDLPEALWGRIGPRTGWLLLFIDPNPGQDGPHPFRILHSDRLGLERQPPADLGPVHDGGSGGPDYGYLLPGEPIPAGWRRWPIDLVSVANTAREENGRTLVAPEAFARILYDAPTGDGAPLPPPPRPLTFGQAHYALAELRRSLDHPIAPAPVPDDMADALKEEGAIQALIAGCGADIRARLAAFDQQGDDAEAQARRAAARKWFEERTACCYRMSQWLAELRTAEAIIAYVEETPAVEQAWQDDVREHVDEVIEALRDYDPTIPLSDQDWNALLETFAAYEFLCWRPDQMQDADGRTRLTFSEYRRSGALRRPAAMHQLVKDLYLDPERQYLLPREIAARYEPHWRDLNDNRPHRMGGYHDGLRSTAVIGPARELLLFQIASDDAMQWAWGDGGACYFWITPDRLAARDFSGVTLRLESR